MLTKEMRDLKKQTLEECRRNGIAVSQGLIRNKTYAGEQALWVEAWIARKAIPWGAHAMAGAALLVAIVGWLFPRAIG